MNSQKIGCWLSWSWRQVTKTMSLIKIQNPSLTITPRQITVISPQPVWTILLQKRKYGMRRKDYIFPELKEEDLQEDFVRGSGPGGQSVNKTSNCVVLKHTPTGIVVKCHETRSLQENRKKARERMQEKIDHLLKGNESFLGKQQSEAMREKFENKQKSRNRLAMKKAFKEREGLD